jgi:hypothetical protein
MDCNLLTDGNVHNRVPSPLPHVIAKNIFLFSIPLSLSLSFSVCPYRPIQSLLTMVGAGCLVLSRSLSLFLSRLNIHDTPTQGYEKQNHHPGPRHGKCYCSMFYLLKIHILSTMSSSSSSSPFFKPPKVFSDTGRDSSSGKRRPFSLLFSFLQFFIFSPLSVSHSIINVRCPGGFGARVDFATDHQTSLSTIQQPH